RQAQHVVERLLLGLVRPHAGAAQRGPEHGVVDGDDGLQAGILVVAEDDLLVAVGVEVLEDHSGLRSRLSGSRMARPAAGGWWVCWLWFGRWATRQRARGAGRAFYAGGGGFA